MVRSHHCISEQKFPHHHLKASVANINITTVIHPNMAVH
ncbi:hypothetical protein B6N60_01269 [Richelia sinica FACHB-800]|uniref:Uncharacterized protein n=1 Tax=Richelia sinica FACHB-800 TaxID=1357546 RepID=A0A975T717_9NOST|nr:hypothetical protein B6N60_01269 [Richelia sinica FACHB-800]